jgi:hypothetical protein
MHKSSSTPEFIPTLQKLYRNFFPESVEVIYTFLLINSTVNEQAAMPGRYTVRE